MTFVILLMRPLHPSSFFFFNDTATTEIYTLSLHDALPICVQHRGGRGIITLKRSDKTGAIVALKEVLPEDELMMITKKGIMIDRKSTRLNSSHSQISYAVFCLKKKKKRRDVRHHVMIWSTS